MIEETDPEPLSGEDVVSINLHCSEELELDSDNDLRFTCTTEEEIELFSGDESIEPPRKKIKLSKGVGKNQAPAAGATGAGLGNTNYKARNWFFTWNNPPGNAGAELKQFLQPLKWCWQLEKGKEGTIHLQGCLVFKNERHFSALKKLFPKLHWEKARNIRHCVEYCSKLDTRIGPVDTQGFKLKKAPRILDEKDFNLWQRKLLGILKTESDLRQIYWFYDKKGNVGKTAFYKWYCVTKPSEALMVNGKASDAKHGIVSFIEKHGDAPRVVFLNVPRKSKDYLSYPGIEEIKDGIFFSGKYESAMCVYDNPHVVIFANFLPDFGALSKDRWKIYEISKGNAFIYSHEDITTYISTN